MAVYVQRITEDRGYYRLTLPKGLVKALGLNKAMVVEIWEGEDDTIIIKEYHAERLNKADSKTN